MIYHIVLPEDWAAALNSGTYSLSTRGVVVEPNGFVHASTGPEQIKRVGELFYNDRRDAFVVALREKELPAAGHEVRYEPADPSDPDSELFPHVYHGPLAVGLLDPVWGHGEDYKVLRSDNPKAQELLSAGWSLGATSWGARLHLENQSDLSRYHEAQAAVPPGITLRLLGTEDIEELARLDAQVAADFPAEVASHYISLIDNLGERLTLGAMVGAGAFDGETLVGYTLFQPDVDRWETDRTGVAAQYRNRGIAQAVKAFAIIHLYKRGVRVFGTGGAGSNGASRAVNQSLGYELEPEWWTLRPPIPWDQFNKDAATRVEAYYGENAP